mgnify:FL=1
MLLKKKKLVFFSYDDYLKKLSINVLLFRHTSRALIHNLDAYVAELHAVAVVLKTYVALMLVAAHVVE